MIGMEIPPRARRRAGETAQFTDWTGNTSACAEKSIPVAVIAAENVKYLRVRGEEPVGTVGHRRGVEIPPRARRRVG